ncbi:MAG TPA: hypothetical protein V6C81_15650 [Planktothrix sp.]|jgi:Flp pilus assembly protein TadG
MVETTTAFLLLIPIGLAAIDITTAVSASHQNEQLAEMCARAAALHPNQQAGQIVAQDAVDRCPIGGVIISVSLGNVTYDFANETVTVETLMHIKLPVPMPYLSEFSTRAESVQPLVSVPPPT